MALGRHQPPVDLGQFGVDAPGSIGSEDQGAFDAVVAGLADPLAGPLGAAGVRPVREEAAEPADVAFGAEALGRVQHADQHRGEVRADAGDGAQGVGRVDLGVERGDAALEPGYGIEMVHDNVDLEGDLGLQLGKVDVVPVQRQSVAGGPRQAVNQRLDERSGMGMIAAGAARDEIGSGSSDGP